MVSWIDVFNLALEIVLDLIDSLDGVFRVDNRLLILDQLIDLALVIYPVVT